MTLSDFVGKEHADYLLCLRDVGLLAARFAERAERVRVNWHADGSGTWQADAVTVSDDGLILAARAADLRHPCPRAWWRVTAGWAGRRGVEFPDWRAHLGLCDQQVPMPALY